MTSKNHLRGGPHYSRNVPDTMSYGAATALAWKIRNFWRDKGYEVKVRVEAIRETDNAGSSNDFQVRSDMVGGRPCLT